MAKRKADPLEHLKPKSSIHYRNMERDQKLMERKSKGKAVSKGKMKSK